MDFIKLEEHMIDELVSIENQLYKSPWSKNAYLDELKNKFSFIYVLVDDIKMIGYYGAWIVSDYATITKVSIAKEYQNNHYSALLMDHMFNLFKKNNVGVVDLEVRISNIKAINLYTKYGFNKDGVRKKYYENTEDALLMSKILKEGENYEKIHISA